MIATTTLEASGQESVTWFTHMLKNYIGFGFLEDYVSYMAYPLWLLMPFILCNAVYSCIVCILYICSLLLYIYKKKNNIQEDTTSKLWDNAKRRITYILDTVGKIWHGYEVIGMEHLPKGPGLIVFYHGAVVFDYAFFLARLYTQTGILIQTLVDDGLYILPGTKLALDLTGCTNGNKSKCVEILKKGNLLGISPGGLREGNFSDHQNYNLIWGNRTGFAQVALEAKVPIIPMFTQNIREAYRIVGKTWWLRWLYDHYIRLLALPIYGGFPVKLRTYLGEPIPYDPNITATELAEKTKIAIENLRDRYQKKPGNILRALSERFDKHHKDN